MLVSGTLTEVAYHLNQWLRRHQIDPANVRVEFHCADYRTQMMVEACHRVDAVADYTMPISNGIATMPPYQHKVYGMTFSWSNQDKWDARGNSFSIQRREHA